MDHGESGTGRRPTCLRSNAARTVAFAIVYVSAVALGRSTRLDGTQLALVWPAAGVAVAWLASSWRTGARLWVDVVLLLAATAAANAATGAPAGIALVFGAANTVQALVACAIFARIHPGGWRLTSFRALGALVAGAAGGAAVSAAVGPASAGLGIVPAWPVAPEVWVLRNAVSVLVVAAVILRVVGDGARPSLRRSTRGWEFAACVAVSLGLYGLVFGVTVDVPVAFLVLPLSVWVALRYDTTLVAVHNLIVGAAMIALTIEARGPFAEQPPVGRVVLAQALIGVIAFVAFVLALHRDERGRLLERLRGRERALTGERDFVDAVLETAEALVIVVDAHGTIVRFNAACERVSGQRADDVIGRPFREVLWPDADRDAIREAFVAGRVRERFEHQWQHADGHLRRIAWTTAVLRDGAGDVEFTIGTGLDVTEQREREEALEVSERRHRTIAEAAGEVLFETDARGRWTYLSPVWKTVTGLPIEESLGSWSQDFVHPGDIQANLTAMASLAAGETPSVNLEHRFTTAAGEERWTRVHAHVVRDDHLGLVGFAGTMRDITDRKRAEDELRQTKALMDAVLDNADAVIYAKDTDGRYLLGNREWERLAGVTIDGARGKTDADLFGRGAETYRANDLAVLAAGRPLALEETLDQPDGEHSYTSTKFPLTDGAGNVIGTGGVSVDVTQLKHAEHAVRASEELHRLVVGNLPDAIVAVWDRDLRCVLARGPMLAANNLNGEDLEGEPPEVVFPAGKASVGQALRAALDGQASELEYVAERNGSIFDLRVAPQCDDAGAVIGAVTVARDVTAKRTAEASLRAAEERFRGAFADAPIGMALATLDGALEQTNSALAAICGRTRPELERSNLRELLHPADIQAGQDAVRALIEGRTDQLAIDVRFLHASGAPVNVSVHGTLIRDAAGRPTQLLGQFQDVTERKRFEQQLQFMADHDPLTGLLNRRKFEIELERHVAQVQRYGAEGAVIVLDIDHFKQVNDTQGHNAGDELIVSIAGVLRSRLRDSDVLARLGGDEFAVLLPKADEREAARVAQALVHGVRNNTTLLSGEHKKVTTSVGVAMLDGDTEELSADSIVVDADLAMYDAKEAGRDRYAFYATSEHRVSRTKARLTWANRIEEALEHDRFALMAQPILDLHTGQAAQHELLLRMLDDRDDLIPPATFLYIAERFGLVGRLDEWVATRAIGLIEQRPDLRLEVNISGRSLGDHHLLETIEHRLRTSRIDPSHLVFEVTETAAVANITQARLFAERLRDLGCRFALDDFGAGFGSFYYLKHLPFDYVKIDGEFVQHAVTGRIDQLVIEAVVRIAQGLGKETIAEFVTDERTQRLLQRLGVDYAQGDHIGKPVRVEDRFGLDLQRERQG
jgi:diguanylate cyclase (GGDEF)-like protein/PAS domain S-box-containing protein